MMPASAFCAANNLPCPKNFTSSQQLGTALRPFPFSGASDFFANTSNSNYNALQVTANMRATHGLTVMANAPNPAGFSILKGHFYDGAIDPVGLLLGALPPTVIAMLAFLLL